MAEETNIILSIKADTSGASSGVDELKNKIGSINNTPIDKPFKNFKAEIKEAIEDAQRLEAQFGKNSAEFRNAATRVAELKDRFGEFNQSISSFNPDNKLNALVSAARGAIGAVQGVTGAMQFLGLQSGSAEQAMAKLQGLMAFSQSLDSIGNIKNSFKDFGNVIQETTIFQKANAAATTVTNVAMKALRISTETTSLGFKVLKGAIIGTGIGALAIGLIALIQNFDKVKEAVLNLIPGLGKVASFIGGIVNAVTDFVGATSEAGRATDKLISDTEKSLKAGQEFLDANGDKYDQFTQRKIKANLEYKQHLIEVNKDESKSEEEKQALLKQYRDKADREINGATADRAAKVKEDTDKAIAEEQRKADEQKKIRDAANAKAKEDAKKAKEDAEKLEQDRLNKEKERNDAITKVRLQAITDEFFKKQVQIDINLDKELEANQELLNKKLITQAQFEAARLGLIQKAADEQSALLLQKAADDEAAKQKVIIASLQDAATGSEAGVVKAKTKNAPNETDSPEDAKAKLDEILQAELQAEQDAFNLKMAQADGNQAQERLQLANHLNTKKNLEDAHAAAVKKIDQAAFQAKQAQITAIGGLLAQASDVVGKQTVAGKAMAVAATTIQTYQSAMSAYAGMTSTIPGPVGIALGVVAAGLSVATGIANIKKILSTKVPKQADGGGSVPTPASIGAAPSITAAATQQQAIQDVRVTNANKPEPIKAYITNGELENNERKNKFLNQVSSF